MGEESLDGSRTSREGLLYAGVRPAPVTGASHDRFGIIRGIAILEESISLKPASDAGLRHGAGRGESNPQKPKLGW